MRRILALVLVAAGCLSAGPFTVGLGNTSKLEFDKGLKLLAGGDLPNAEISLKKVIQTNPRYVPAFVAMAEIRVRQKRNAEADDFFRQALAIDPTGPELQRSLARFYVAQGKPELAVNALKKVALTQDSGAVETDLGGLYLAQGKPDLALAAFRTAVTLSPREAAAHRGYGTALAVKKLVPQAQAALLRAYELEPRDPANSFSLAMFYQEQGELLKAKEFLGKTLESDPRHAPALVALGDIHGRGNEAAKAIELYNRALALNPAPATYMRIGTLQQTAGKTAEAEAAYRKALEADPNLSAACNNLAFLLLSLKRELPEAESLARRAVRAQPANPNYQDTLAQVLKARGGAAR